MPFILFSFNSFLPIKIKHQGHLFSQKGSAIIKVMVFFSVLMIIAGAAATMATIQAKQVKKSKKKEEIYSLTRQLKNSLQNFAICKQALTGKPDNAVVDIDYILLTKTVKLIEKNAHLNSSQAGLEINTIQFKDIQNWSTDFKKGTLEVSFKKNDSDALKPIRLPLFVKVGAGAIIECADFAVFEQTLPVVSGIKKLIDCPNQDEIITFAHGSCDCGGVTSTPEKIASNAFITSDTTGKYWFNFTCHNCNLPSVPVLSVQLGCSLKEGYM